MKILGHAASIRQEIDSIPSASPRFQNAGAGSVNATATSERLRNFFTK
jgi:hypothetical protein